MATADGGNIMYRKKQIGNGDIEKDIKDTLKQKKQSKALKTQLEKMAQTMDSYDKSKKNGASASEFKPFSKIRKTKDKDQFHRDLKKVARNQSHLNEQLNQVPFNKKNPNSFFSKNKKLPSSLSEIDDNIELAKLLLKNPEKMTDEEKVYIASFSNREFKLFIEYLKMKDKELKWQGNGYGSGHYSEGFISIYRKYGQSENERYSSLRKFLKLNYKNSTAKQLHLQETEAGSLVGFQQEEGFSGDCNANTNYDMQAKPYDDYELQSKEIQKQMTAFKTILDWHKKEADINRYKNMNDLLNQELDAKTTYLKEDLEKVKGYKRNTNGEVDNLYQQYLTNGHSQYIINSSADTVDQKIKAYLVRMNLTSYELAKKFSEAATFENFQKGMVHIPTAQKQFVTLLILTENESKELCQLLIKYNGIVIRTEFFADFIDRDAQKVKNATTTGANINQFEEEEGYGGDNLNADDFDLNANEEEDDADYSYDGDNYFSKKIIDKDAFKRTVISKHLGDFEEIMEKKGATQIQKMVRGFIVKKRVRSERIYLYLLAKRICKLIRLNYERRMLLKSKAVQKIINFIRRKTNKAERSYLNYSSRWLQPGFSAKGTKKFTSASEVIQQVREQYQLKFAQNASSKQLNAVRMDEELLKTKICFMCHSYHATYLCRDCDKNHYCERCFKQYHMHGQKKHHTYLTTTEMFDDCKKQLNPKQINEIHLMRAHLKEKEVCLGELLINWDFHKDGTIKARHLKDALAIKGYDLDQEYQAKIFNFALSYIKRGRDEGWTVDDYAISLEFTNAFV